MPNFEYKITKYKSQEQVVCKDKASIKKDSNANYFELSSKKIKLTVTNMGRSAMEK